MFPHGGGSIAVQNPREFGLPPSMVALDALGNNVSDTEIYEVSVIRQLGCLVRFFFFFSFLDLSIFWGCGFHLGAIF